MRRHYLQYDVILFKLNFATGHKSGLTMQVTQAGKRPIQVHCRRGGRNPNGQFLVGFLVAAER